MVIKAGCNQMGDKSTNPVRGNKVHIFFQENTQFSSTHSCTCLWKHVIWKIDQHLFSLAAYLAFFCLKSWTIPSRKSIFFPALLYPFCQMAFGGLLFGYTSSHCTNQQGMFPMHQSTSRFMPSPSTVHSFLGQEFGTDLAGKRQFDSW